jgi:hypothetical protein
VFVVKYAAVGGQRALAQHKDGSELSFVVSLNDASAYGNTAAASTIAFSAQEASEASGDHSSSVSETSSGSGGSSSNSGPGPGSDQSSSAELSSPSSSGGTGFAAVMPPLVVRPAFAGTCVSFCGAQPHCGLVIAVGVRYALAGFVRVRDDDYQGDDDQRTQLQVSASEAGVAAEEEEEGNTEPSSSSEDSEESDAATNSTSRSASNGVDYCANAYAFSYHGSEVRQMLATGGLFCDCTGASCAEKRRKLGDGVWGPLPLFGE